LKSIWHVSLPFDLGILDVISARDALERFIDLSLRRQPERTIYGMG
jgi:hypothetical protein